MTDDRQQTATLLRTWLRRFKCFAVGHAWVPLPSFSVKRACLRCGDTSPSASVTPSEEQT